MKKRIIAVILGAALFTLAACGNTANTESAENTENPANTEGTANAENTEEAEADAASATEQKVITFAYRNTGNWPVSGEDESGNPSGYDIEVLRAVDDLLEDYTFEYVGTSYDDAYIGIEAGNYDAALTNAFWTEERAEKYLIPEEPLGASVLVLAVRAEDADIKNLTDLSKSGKELAPILAGNGMYYVVKQYNSDNPDNQVEIKVTDDSTYVAGSVEEIVAGKYAAGIFTKPSFDNTVIAEDGDLHQFLTEISYSEFTLANTYPMFSKNVGEDFVNKLSDTLKQVKDSGKASEISEQFFGYDIWNYEF